MSGLYAALGKSVGSEFSPEDVSFLFQRVFHVRSGRDEASVAMNKVSARDSSWSCAGENVLDVLVQMEREREEKEKMFWELQLVNAGKMKDVSRGSETSSQCRSDRRAEDPQKRWTIRALRRLKKSTRQTWARLVSEGVQSIFACTCQDSSFGVIGQAWGWVTLSDVLLLVEVKYDVVTHVLYTEMLREHHTAPIWETMSPWQRETEEAELEDCVEEALESRDLVGLAQVPGSLEMHSVGPEFRRTHWTSVSLLWRVNRSRQQEREALSTLGERLDTKSLRLMCLHVRCATLRAQREKESYRALLAAQQSWESWPRVCWPCREDLAASCLHGEDDHHREVYSVSPRRATLQSLVLSQEGERKQLIRVLRDVSLEDLRTPEKDAESDLRSGCMKKLLQLHQQKLPTDSPQNEEQLEDVKVKLLSLLLELQEREASVLLQSLVTSRQSPQNRQFETPVSSKLPHGSSSDHEVQAPTCSTDGQQVIATNQEASNTDVVCSGCGLVMEELPYLEIFSPPDVPGCTQAAAEGRPLEEEECTAAAEEEDLEKQASLIPLAWSKPPEEESRGCAGDQTLVHICGPNSPEEGSEDLCGPAGDPATPFQLCMEATQGQERLPAVEKKEENISAEETQLQEPPQLTPGQQHQPAAEIMTPLLEKEREPQMVLERELTVQNLVDMQRKVEQKHQRDKERQLLRVQERLSIIQSRKSEEDVLGHRERLRHLRQDLEQVVADGYLEALDVQGERSMRLAEGNKANTSSDPPQNGCIGPSEDRDQQKTLVRERLEELRRERSYVMQSRRDRNTAGLKELLNPLQREGQDEAAV